MTQSVLVVDDSEADQFLTQYALSKFDSTLTIHQAHDGEEAIDLVSQDELVIDLIFLDINMPRMDGIEFLEAYGKLELKNTAVIVMLTSSIREDDYNKCMAYPFVKQCLSKPLGTEALAELL